MPRPDHQPMLGRKKVFPVVFEVFLKKRKHGPKTNAEPGRGVLKKNIAVRSGVSRWGMYQKDS